MKRVLSLLLLLALGLALPAYAAEEIQEPAPIESTETFVTQVDGEKGITINVTVPAAATPEPVVTTPPPAVEDPAPQAAPADLSYTAYALDEAPAVLPAAEGELQQLPDLLVRLFGPYEPKTQTVTEHLADGSDVTYQQYVPGIAGMDMEWLTSVGLFALFLFCVLKLIGGLLKL